MSTLGGTLPTILDQAKRTDPDGSIAEITELLTEQTPWMEDAVSIEGNETSGHTTTVRTGLPPTYWRHFNTTVPVGKSTTAQITYQCGNLTACAQIDADLLKRNDNSAGWLKSEQMAFIEAMAIEMQDTMIYGTSAASAEFVGFMENYNDLGAASGQNVLDAGGTGSDNTSIILVGHGQRKIYNIYPKGSKVGLDVNVRGIETVEDGTGIGGAKALAHLTFYGWQNGLVVEDWRYGGRIANIDVSDLTGVTGTQAITASTNIVKLMSKLVNRLHSRKNCRPVLYVNRTVADMLYIMGLEYSSSALSVQDSLDQFGNTIHTMSFRGIPIKIMDGLTEAESQVV
jgi:hypothetical protein